MGPKRRARRIARNAKYTVPVGEHTPGGEARVNRKGGLKRGYKMLGVKNTDNRVPYSTVATPKRFSKRRRVTGSVTPKGKGKTNIYN